MTEAQLSLLRSKDSLWMIENSRFYREIQTGMRVPTCLTLYNIRIPKCSTMIAKVIFENMYKSCVETNCHVYYFGVTKNRMLRCVETCGIELSSCLPGYCKDKKLMFHENRVYFTVACDLFPIHTEVAPHYKTLLYHGKVRNYRQYHTLTELESWSLLSEEVTAHFFSSFTVQVTQFVPKLLSSELNVTLDTIIFNCLPEDQEFTSRVLVSAMLQQAVEEDPAGSWIDPFVSVDVRCEDIVQRILQVAREKYDVCVNDPVIDNINELCHMLRTCSVYSCQWNTFEGKMWDSVLDYRGGYKFAKIGLYKTKAILYDFASMYPSVLLQTEVDSTPRRVISRVVLSQIASLMKQRPDLKVMLKKMANTTIGYMGTYKANVGLMKCVNNRSVLAATCRISRLLLMLIIQLGEKVFGFKPIYADTDSVMFAVKSSSDCILKTINDEWLPTLLSCNRDECFITMRVDVQISSKGVHVERNGKYTILP